MNNIFRNISGVAVFLLIVIPTLGLLLNNLTKKSFYESSGTVQVEGIGSQVSIYSNDYGVPFIYAEDESDMYFTLGYLHARDRLWQMDLYRRVAEGRLSEILGRETLDIDVLFRTVGIDKSANGIYQTLSSESKQILTSYTAGINFFIGENISRLPLEFDILNYKPDMWTPENSVMIIRLMAWELNLSWYTDVMFGEIVKKFGMEKAVDLFPSYPEDGPFILTQGTTRTKTDTNSVRKDTTNKSSRDRQTISSKSLAGNFFDMSRQARMILGSEAIHIGSNSWVVSGSKTDTKKPLLANDPHLALQSPAKWYEVSMYNGSRRMSVSGFSLPGAPGIAIGHNDVVAWGLTNLMCDDSDFFVMKRDSADKSKFVFNRKAYSLDSTVEAIKIKDSADDHVFTAYRTNLGPVVSNLVKTGFGNSQDFTRDTEDEILSFRWTGFEQSDEVLSFYRINFAKNKDSFKEGLRSFGSPALNFVYSDTTGNIGYIAAGLVPKRDLSDRNASMFPSEDGLQWNGFIPFEELPSVINPAQGYIVTANNKPKSDYPYYISNLYEPHYRAQRIEQLLEQLPVVTADEMKLIQRDVKSLQAEEFCSYLFKAFGDSATWTEDIRRYLDLLMEWDYEFGQTSSSASLFAMFEVKLYENMYLNLLGEELFDDYIFLKNIPVRNTSRILKQSSSLFFSNEEEKDQLIRKSFYESVSALIAKYGNEPVSWQWGDIHRITLKHPLGVVPALSSMLNVGPYKISGSGTTVNNMEYSFLEPLKSVSFEAYLGPSMRMIVDLSKPGSHYSVLAGGQSGQPLQENYSNQARLWANGDYKIVSNVFEDLRKEYLNLFTLQPVR